MKLLCVIDSLGSGGAQRQLIALAIGFKEEGHEVSFLIYHNVNFYKELTDNADILIHPIVESNYFKRLIKMRAYIRNGNFDGVISFLEGANFICEMASLPNRKWKLVVGERSANPNIYRNLRLRAYRYFHCLSDYVVTNSYANARIIRKINPLISKRKLLVIYNIVDFLIWKPSRTYLPRNNGKFLLIIVSNHQYVKNAKGLVQAVNILPQVYKDQLLIHWYGRKNTFELVEAFIDAKDLVHRYDLQNSIYFFDPQPSISKIVSRYDALGLFSFYEGLPNSICEAMASGKPVIATNVSDNNLIIDNDITGFIINGFDPVSIKNGLVRLLDCTNERLIEMGRKSNEKARLILDKEKIVNNYLRLLT